MPIVGGKGAKALIRQRRSDRVSEMDPCHPISLNGFRQAIQHDSIELARDRADSKANDALARVQHQILGDSGKGFMFFEIEDDDGKDHLLR